MTEGSQGGHNGDWDAGWQWRPDGAAPNPNQAGSAFDQEAPAAGSGWAVPGATPPPDGVRWQAPAGQPGQQPPYSGPQGYPTAPAGWSQPPPGQPPQGYQSSANQQGLPGQVFPGQPFPPQQGFSGSGYGPQQGYPGYPGGPGYGAPPSAGYPVAPGFGPGGAPTWSSFRPGIVPLRPLQMGDVLSGAMSLLRFNPAATLGLSLIVQIVVGLVSIPAGVLLAQQVVSGQAETITDVFWSTMPTMLAALMRGFTGLLLAGLLAYVAAEAVLGRKPRIGQVWSAVKGRLPTFIAVNLAIAAAWVLAIVAVIALGVGLARVSDSGALVVILPFVVLALAVVAVWLSIKLMFTGQSVVLENSGFATAFQRSFALTKSQFWRLFGINLVAGIIASVVSSALGFPLQAVAGLIITEANSAVASGSALVVTLLTQLLAMVLVAPFTAGVNCLLYIDSRIRKEGFDMTLLSAIDGGRSPWALEQPPA